MVTEALKPMAGDVAGNDNGAVTDSRSLVDSLVASGALDPLFERIDGGWIELTGDGGLPGELTRVALERGLQAEMTSHLGYAPGDGGVEGGRRACELAQRFVSQDAVHAGGRGGRAGSPRQGRLVRPEVGAQAFREAGRTGRDDHIPVRGRHDGARHPAPPWEDDRRGPGPRDDIRHHRRGERRRARMAGAAAGRVLSGRVPGRRQGQGARQRQGAAQGGAHRHRRRHGRVQACAWRMGPGRRGRLLLGARVRRDGQPGAWPTR